MEKRTEYIDRRPISFLDLLVSRSPMPEKFFWARLAYQLTVIVTQACNMQCTYCYDKSRNEKEIVKSELSSEEIIKIIQEARSVGVRQIKLTGGEVFVKRGIEKILEACQGIALYLCTNGKLLGEWIPFLSRMNFEQLHIHTSLDGLDSHLKYSVNGISYEKLLENMKMAKEVIKGVHASINTVLNKDNIAELSAMHPQLVAADIDKWTVSMPYIVSEIVRNKHPFPAFDAFASASAELLSVHFGAKEPLALSIGGMYKYEMFDSKTIPKKSPMDHPCMPNCNGARGLIIDSFGNILDCLLDNVEEKGVMRNLKSGDFIPLASGVIQRPFYKMQISETEECVACRYLALCGGGCRYNAAILFENRNNPDPIRCSYYPLMEKYIFPILPEDQRRTVLSYINTSGSEPPFRFGSVKEIFAGLKRKE